MKLNPFDHILIQSTDLQLFERAMSQQSVQDARSGEIELTSHRPIVNNAVLGIA